ncbi:hypothetical protein [uncultured Sphingomonas sp.]|uniref:hypothetical protein n=1 Tax=uncultured Sphingomonas sp. TaxID=158754 RepID=UPI0025CE2478|nr:hypothetical protein [uncultured Sphingomonas sp.]
MAGLGNKMREWCDEAGLPQCAAHDLRKAIARRMVAVEATQQQMGAVGGCKGDAEVAAYVADAAQEQLAEAAIAKVVSQFSDERGS